MLPIFKKSLEKHKTGIDVLEKERKKTAVKYVVNGLFLFIVIRKTRLKLTLKYVASNYLFEFSRQIFGAPVRNEL